MPKTVTTERFDHLIDHILDNNVISFTDDDIPAEGIRHRKPLYIVVILSGFVLGGVLIDGGLALNVCPYDTLERININHNHIRDSHMW